MSKHDLTIFRYSTILTLTRNGISTIAELDAMTNEDIGRRNWKPGGRRQKRSAQRPRSRQKRSRPKGLRRRQTKCRL